MLTFLAAGIAHISNSSAPLMCAATGLQGGIRGSGGISCSGCIRGSGDISVGITGSGDIRVSGGISGSGGSEVLEVVEVID